MAWLVQSRRISMGKIRWFPGFSDTLWLCQNSYWKWPFIVEFPINHGDFPVRYVKLPEGTKTKTLTIYRCGCPNWLLDNLLVSLEGLFVDGQSLHADEHLKVVMVILAKVNYQNHLRNFETWFHEKSRVLLHTSWKSFFNHLERWAPAVIFGDVYTPFLQLQQIYLR